MRVKFLVPCLLLAWSLTGTGCDDPPSGPSTARVCENLVACDPDTVMEDCLVQLGRFRDVLTGAAWSDLGGCLAGATCEALAEDGFSTCFFEAMQDTPPGSADPFLEDYCEKAIDCGRYDVSVDECVDLVKENGQGYGEAMGILNRSTQACLGACVAQLPCDRLDDFYELCSPQCGLSWNDPDDACSDHGTWEDDRCVCEAGYTGQWCEACDAGFRPYDDDCVEDCTEDTCGGHGACSIDGYWLACDCLEGYEGERCERCASYYHLIGGECQPTCVEDTCSYHGQCTSYPSSFDCSCDLGYTGERCDQCQQGWYSEGADCLPVCTADSCSGHGTCEGWTGTAVCTCDEGYEGDACDACVSGWRREGDTCVLVCVPGACHDHGICDGTSGAIVCACYENYTGATCDACAPGHTLHEGTCLLPVAELAAGSLHTCARFTDGSVRCWGDGTSGKLGYGNTDHVGDDELPADVGFVSLGGPATALCAGTDHTCALLASGAVRCWGSNENWQLGLPGATFVGDDELPSSVPAVDVGGTVVELACGREHTCARLSTGAVRCWGDWMALGYGYDLIVGDDETPAAAGDLNLGGQAVQLSAGHFHNCARLSTGALRCWGNHGRAQLGIGNIGYNWVGATPAALGDLSVGGAVAEVSCGAEHTCVRLADQTVKCWGYGLYGATGYGSTADLGDNELPSSYGAVPVGDTVAFLDAGSGTTCVITTGGDVRCWGFHGLGVPGHDMVGDDETPDTLPPVQTGAGVVSVAVGDLHACALYASGRIRCWGIDMNGLLGLGPGGCDGHVGDDEHPDELSWVPLFR